MELLVEQLERRVAELSVWRESEQGPPAEVRLIREDVPDARLPDFDDAVAPVLVPGSDWREPTGAVRWLRFRLSRPEEWPADETALLAQRFGTLPPEPTAPLGRMPGQRLQGILYLDGKEYHGLDQYHRLILLPPGPDYQFAANIWTGLAEFEWQPAPVFRLVRVDCGATQLYHDLRVLHDALRTLEADHTARPDLERLVERALLAIDWSCPGSESFRASLADTHALVADELQRLGAAGYEPKLVAAGHAHIDCAWLWPIAQTREKAGRTWSTALRLMERYPEYHFLASTPLQYEMVKEKFPDTFEGIRQRVREGRWEALGGMWVEADCNLPDGESLARQLLVGTRYFEREFGIDTRVVWLPDSFGFTWALPTLMAAAGLPYFVTHKLSWNQTNRIPHDTFRWRGPDGSDVLAHFLCMPVTGSLEIGRSTYNGDPMPGTARGAWRRFQDRGLYDELLVAFGWGDGGGGPTIDMLEANRRLADLPGFPRVRPGTARDFFQRMERALAERVDVPVWDGELYFELHRGTYTSQARQKLRNAQSQRLYHAAELYAATARALLGTSYPRDRLDQGWRLILTNQFHDILPGSAIGQVYLDAEADYQQLAAIGEQVLAEATRSIASGIDLDADALVVFNPSPYPSADYLELPAEFAAAPPAGEAGQPLPAQPTADGGLLVFCNAVPANGYRAFRLGGSVDGRSDNTIRATARQVVTPFWEIDLNDRGHITRLWDKARARDVVPTGQSANRLVVFEDKPLNWDAWDIDAYFARKGRDVGLIQMDAEPVERLEAVRVREAGPERAVLEFRWQYGESTRISQRLCVYARSPRIDFVTDVDWQERQSLLKVAFPTQIRNRRATYEIQFGTIDRPTHRNTSWDEAAFEVPAQRWMDLSDAHYGVALISDCKHGYSVREQTLWLSLLKSAVDPDPEAERGEHHFTYSLLAHAAGLESVRRAAYGLTRPLIWRRETAHASRLPRQFSLAQSSHPSVIVETAKWAEDEDALVMRLYEADGGSTGCLLTLGGPASEIAQVDLLERNPRPLSVDQDGKVPLEFRAREVKTLLLRLASQEA
jgi:alpha-mannosidase